VTGASNSPGATALPSNMTPNCLAMPAGPRMGRNPKTGAEVPIAPRRVMVFKASDTLKKRLAAGGAND
jgi:Bacterial DNA-binding protein